VTSSSSEAASRSLVVSAPRETAGAPAWLVSLFVTSIALWIGAAVFFSGGVLAVLFTSLPPSEAGSVAALLFPLYFRSGLALGVVACLAAALLARVGGRRWKAVAALVVLMTLAQGWSTLVIHPEMALIRGVEAEVPRFQQLHELSVRLNGVVLAGGVLLLAAGGFLFSIRRETEPFGAGARRRGEAS
jgi:hypothetical protein